MAAGELDKAHQALAHIIAEYEKLGVKRVVLNCPGCLKTFRHDAPALLGRPLPFEARHILEEMAYLTEQGEIKFKPVSPEMTVTYHDSCTLAAGWASMTHHEPCSDTSLVWRSKRCRATGAMPTAAAQAA